MDLANLQPAEGSNTAAISAEAVVMRLETEKLLVRDIKARKLVLELPDRDLKVARCLYTEEFPREDLPAETASRSWESM